MVKTALIIATLLALLATCIGWVILGWEQTANVQMTVHGYIAMILGIVFSLH